MGPGGSLGPRIGSGSGSGEVIVRIEGLEVLYVDVEASSIEKGSFPIEVGWCVDDETDPESFLVAPAPGWDVVSGWSAVSQGFHGITLDDLARDGIAVRTAAARIEAAFGHRMVVSDNPEFDEFWLGMIYDAAGLPMRWEVHHVDEVFKACVTANPISAAAFVRAFKEVEHAYPHPHRAAPDALRMAKKGRALADPVYRESLIQAEAVRIGRHGIRT